MGTAVAVAAAPRSLAREPNDKLPPNDPRAPGASPGWDVPPSTLPGDPSTCPVEHIGILMMENRSYDTYYGWLEGGRGFLQLGLDLRYSDPADPAQSGSPEHWAPVYRRCGHPDPDHGWEGGRAQLANGFLAGRNDQYALAYYLAEDIPAFARLARQFTVFDRYFCSVMGPTYPNRHYQHGATSEGTRTTEIPVDHATQGGFRFPTIWDRLDAAGLTSAYYFVDLPFLAMYGEQHLDKLRPISQYYIDAALGRLPNVFFVEPGFLGDQRTDDHPGGSDMNAAQAYVNNVVARRHDLAAVAEGSVLRQLRRVGRVLRPRRAAARSRRAARAATTPTTSASSGSGSPCSACRRTRARATCTTTGRTSTRRS